MPGHVFPLAARDGGVLVRAGHTEAAVDIARLAGLRPAGVICEIMNDDGTMARLPDLVTFAQRHGLKIGTIADLIAYRRRTEKLVDRLAEHPFRSRIGGEFRLVVYQNRITGVQHLALVKGEIAAGKPTLVRMHALNVLDDVLLDADSPRSGELTAALAAIGRAERGVLILIREAQPLTILERLAARAEGTTPARPSGSAQLREYGVGAQILGDLGVGKMVLLSNTRRTIVGLEGYDLEVVEQRPIDPEGGA